MYKINSGNYLDNSKTIIIIIFKLSKSLKLESKLTFMGAGFKFRGVQVS